MFAAPHARLLCNAESKGVRCRLVGLQLLLFDDPLVLGKKLAFEDAQPVQFLEQKRRRANSIRQAVIRCIFQVLRRESRAPPAKSKLYSRSNALSTGEAWTSREQGASRQTSLSYPNNRRKYSRVRVWICASS